MKIVRNHAIQEGTLLLAVCGWLAWYCLDGYGRAFNKDWSQSPYLFPMVMAVLLGLLGLLLLGQGIRSLRAGQKADAQASARQGVLRVGGLAVLCLAYYLGLAWIDLPYLAFSIGAVTLQLSTFEVTTFVFLVAMMLYMGVRRPAVLTLVPLGATLFLSVMFRSLLHVILP